MPMLRSTTVDLASTRYQNWSGSPDVTLQLGRPRPSETAKPTTSEARVPVAACASGGNPVSSAPRTSEGISARLSPSALTARGADAAAAQLAEALEALLLEEHVAHGQGLGDDVHVGIDVGEE